MFEFARAYDEVFKYFPDEIDWWRLPRTFIANVMNSFIGAPFSSWVSEGIAERNSKAITAAGT